MLYLLLTSIVIIVETTNPRHHYLFKDQTSLVTKILWSNFTQTPTKPSPRSSVIFLVSHVLARFLPSQSVQQELSTLNVYHPWYLINFLILHNLAGPVWWLWHLLNKISVSLAIISPYSWYHLLVISHSLTPTLFLGHKFPLVHTVFGVESSVSPTNICHCRCPMYITLVLYKVCLSIFKKCHEYIYIYC